MTKPKPPSEKLKVGRPSPYDAVKTPVIAKAFSMLGYTDVQLAAIIGVANDTIHAWKKEHPEFSDALKEGKAFYDSQVITAMQHNAVGYDYVEEVAVKNKYKVTEPDSIGENGKRIKGKIMESEKWEVLKVKKHKTSETLAGMYWLNCRRPEEFRNVKAVELTGKDGKPIETETKNRVLDVKTLPTEVLEQIRECQDETKAPTD